MRKLVTYSLYLLGTVLVIMYALEGAYRWSYSHGTPRDKVQWLRSFEDKSNFDYVILGSSRSLHTINPVQIDTQIGKNGINLGSPANGPFEIRLMFEEFIKHAQAKKVFIQVDYRNSEVPDPLGRVGWMPYITDDAIYNSFKHYEGDYHLYKYLPYYRFLKFDPKIGLRNVVLSLGGKGKTISEFNGFIPIDHQIKDVKKLDPNYPTAPNQHLIAIQEKAQELGMEVHFFTAPIFNNSFDFGPFNSYLHDYKDLSNRLTNPAYFADNTHCNQEGAVAFTDIFINEYFRSKSN